MHPPERGFGKPPRTSQDDPASGGSRPLLQGHLKRRTKAADPRPSPSVKDSGSTKEAASTKDAEAAKPARRRRGS